MSRIHLFEFEDQKWLPSFLRNYMTDFLSHLSNQLDIFKPIVPIIGKALEASSENKIIDLGSGAGGGWDKLSTHLQKDHPDTKILLSDYFPNLAAMSRKAQCASNVKFIKESIDARRVPKEIKGLRTLNPDKTENSISKMVINILGIVSEIERTQILERQRQGIDLAKSKGVYKGRKIGTQEDTLKFLSKPKNKKVIELLRKGYKSGDISTLVGVHINTITKIKKVL